MSREAPVRICESVGVRLPCATRLLIQSPKKDPRIWKEAKDILEGLGLTINEDKTQFPNAREGFDYLGYHFVRDYSKRHEKDVTHVIPTHESKKRVWEKVRWYTDKRRYQNLPIAWVVKQINPILNGWTNYYRHTHSHRIFGELQTYTNDRIRKALRYRSKKGGVGKYRELPNMILYNRYGLSCIGMNRIQYCWS